MHYKGEIEIDRPISTVAELFSDPSNRIHYQDGFLRKELIKGEAGQDGAVSRMFYQMGKKEMMLTETIVFLANLFFRYTSHRTEPSTPP